MRSVRKTLGHARLLLADQVAVGVFVIIIVAAICLLVPLPD